MIDLTQDPARIVSLQELAIDAAKHGGRPHVRQRMPLNWLMELGRNRNRLFGESSSQFFQWGDSGIERLDVEHAQETSGIKVWSDPMNSDFVNVELSFEPRFVSVIPARERYLRFTFDVSLYVENVDDTHPLGERELRETVCRELRETLVQAVTNREHRPLSMTLVELLDAEDDGIRDRFDFRSIEGNHVPEGFHAGTLDLEHATGFIRNCNYEGEVVRKIRPDDPDYARLRAMFDEDE